MITGNSKKKKCQVHDLAAYLHSCCRFRFMIFFCLFCILIGIIPAGCNKEAPEQAFPPATVLAAKSVQKDMPVVINAIGTVEAYKSVSIYARVGGQLLQAHFKEGQDVRHGQMLFTVDPASYREKLRQAEGALGKNLAQMKYNDQEAKRYAFLYEKGAVSKSEAEKFRTDAAAYESTVKSDKAVVEEARLNLEYCFIRAPFEGRTGGYSVNIGAIIKANDTALATLNQIVPIHVRFSVPEKYLSDVKRYMQAGSVQVKVSPTADFKGEVRTGKLVFIDNTVDANTGMIQLKAEFPNADRLLWPGQFVNVALHLTVQPGAIVVPLRAIQMSEKGQFVFVVKPDMTVDLRPLAVDRSVGEDSIIAKGLSAGEMVVTDGHLKVRPGGKVEIKESLEASIPGQTGQPTATAEGAKK
jgi:multidrug efflux system membrane fusion protein